MSGPGPLRVLLTVWDPQLGACVYPIGVLAVDEATVAVAWLPRTYDRADAWRARLGDTDAAAVAAALPDWLAQTGGAQAELIDPGRAGADIRTAAEAALDDLLTTVVPLFDERR